jgi:hypothetical protein
MAGGRPSKYESHVKPKLTLIEAWARDGITDEQIAANLGVAYSTFRDHKAEYPALAAALKNGKEVIDVMVENALLKAALGYEYEEVTENGLGTSTTTKVAHPNTTALIFWLKNRKPKEWRDKQDLELSGTVQTNVKHDLKKLDRQELLQLEHILEKSAESGTGSTG